MERKRQHKTDNSDPNDPYHIPYFLLRKNWTAEERIETFKPTPMRNFPIYNREKSPREIEEANKLAAEMTAQQKTKKQNKSAKALDKQTDHIGQRWDARLNKWVPDNPKEKESTMATKTKKSTTAKAKKPAKITTKAKTKKAAPTKEVKAKKANGKTHTPRDGSKMEIIRDFLTRKQGCTTKDLLAELKWPAISIPEQARKLGLKLTQEKVKKGDDRARTVYHAS